MLVYLDSPNVVFGMEPRTVSILKSTQSNLIVTSVFQMYVLNYKALLLYTI